MFRKINSSSNISYDIFPYLKSISSQGKTTMGYDIIKYDQKSFVKGFRTVTGNPYWSSAVNLVFMLYLLRRIHTVYIFLRGYGIYGSIKIAYRNILNSLFKTLLSLPPMRAKVQKEIQQGKSQIESMVIKNDSSLLQLAEIPENGVEKEAIMSELDKLNELKHSDWSKGKVSGAVYHGGDILQDIQTEAYRKYAVANQLHPDVFPGVRKIEAEVVSMVLKLFHAPEEGCGSSTSGGTESLLLTGLAAREYGRRYRGISNPEIIAPITVHAGIEKACYYFGIKLWLVDLDPVTFQVDLKKVRRFINSNTVMLVGSAPNFPHGIVDNIEGLSALASKHNLLLHVDACLGSFIMPFLEDSNIHGDKILPKFDFRLPGVTSISCDTHKYGFAPKGSSVIMYRNQKLRECQYYVSSDWTGGLYGSPTLAGSRPGALMVGCWSTLIYIGKNGYLQSCKEIVGASMKFKKAITEDEFLSQHLKVLGDPIGSVVSFTAISSSTLNIYQLGDQLNEKGWHLSSLQKPPALHFAFTRLTVPVVDELINDVKTCIITCITSHDLPESKSAAMYGVAGSIATADVANTLIVSFLDSLYKV